MRQEKNPEHRSEKEGAIYCADCHRGQRKSPDDPGREEKQTVVGERGWEVMEGRDSTDRSVGTIHSLNSY